MYNGFQTGENQFMNSDSYGRKSLYFLRETLFHRNLSANLIPEVTIRINNRPKTNRHEPKLQVRETQNVNQKLNRVISPVIDMHQWLTHPTNMS